MVLLVSEETGDGSRESVLTPAHYQLLLTFPESDSWLLTPVSRLLVPTPPPTPCCPLPACAPILRAPVARCSALPCRRYDRACHACGPDRRAMSTPRSPPTG